MTKKIKEDVIERLPYPECVRRRIGMYLSGNDKAATNTALREIQDNACDEINSGYGKTIYVSNDFNGFNAVFDDGRGIPIAMNKEGDKTQAYLSISELHAGSKFNSTTNVRVGQNGSGSAIVSACSEVYFLLSKITEDNYNRSIPAVRDAWNNAGPRSKNDLYYIVITEKGEKTYEGAGRLKDLEKMIFGNGRGMKPIPQGFSTLVFFKLDATVFEESIKPDISLSNLQYFLLIQQKFYKRKVNVIVNDQELSGQFNSYKFEAVNTIVPKDTSMNSQVGVYVTFEADPKLGPKTELGSVNGLEVNQGVHINYIETAFKTALQNIYKIKHDYLLNGLKICVILLAGEVIFDSQTKSRLKSITKVKVSDFNSVVKDIEKIIKKNSEYWDLHVSKLNKLAESMKDIGAAELADKMMEGSSGVGLYRSKTDIVPGFAEATGKDRMSCELFLCFTGDTEILTCNNEKIAFKDLVSRINTGENIYTFSCDSNGVIEPSKIIAAKKIKTVDKIVKVILNGGKSFRCTPDHKILLEDKNYVEAGNLKLGDKLTSMTEINEVIDIKFIEVTEDVYCLEVDNPLHNFPLASGVFAKNCEGLSASGSLVTARPDTTRFAVLPLRGKILNVTNVSTKRAMESQVIYSIFKTIGLGLDVNNVTRDCKTIEEAQEVIKQKSRYGKIVIATDPD